MIYLGAIRPASMSNEFPSGLTSNISPSSSERTLRKPLSSSPITVALNDDLSGWSTVTSVLLIKTECRWMIIRNLGQILNCNNSIQK